MGLMLELAAAVVAACLLSRLLGQSACCLLSLGIPGACWGSPGRCPPQASLLHRPAYGRVGRPAALAAVLCGNRGSSLAVSTLDQLEATSVLSRQAREASQGIQGHMLDVTAVGQLLAAVPCTRMNMQA